MKGGGTPGTARLALHCRRQVLACNHVFEMLMRVAQGEGWPEAIMAVLPPRKGAVLREASPCMPSQ